MTITIAIPWYRREDFERIKEICERQYDYFTFDEWEAGANATIDKINAVYPDVEVTKVMTNPDELLKYAKDHGHMVIDGGVRAQFAAMTAAKQKGN